MAQGSTAKRRYVPKRQDYVCVHDLERVAFPDTDMTVRELVREYCPDQIPLFIKVSYGYCGANAVDLTFSTDEVSYTRHDIGWQ